MQQQVYVQRQPASASVGVSERRVNVRSLKREPGAHSAQEPGPTCQGSNSVIRECGAKRSPEGFRLKRCLLDRYVKNSIYQRNNIFDKKPPRTFSLTKTPQGSVWPHFDLKWEDKSSTESHQQFGCVILTPPRPLDRSGIHRIVSLTVIHTPFPVVAPR